jgi:amino acid transporter
MVIFTAINLMGVKKFAKTNAALVWFKIAVPLLTAISLIAVAFKSSNFSAGGGFLRQPV